MDSGRNLLTPVAVIKPGVLSSGFAAGYAFGLTSSQIAIVFDRTFTRGDKVFLPLVGISSLSYIYAALQSTTHKTLLGLSTPAQLTVASLSILLTLPWTRIRKILGVNRLRAASPRAEKEFEATAGGVDDITTARADLEDWELTNGLRGALLSVAGVLGATAL